MADLTKLKGCAIRELNGVAPWGDASALLKSVVNELFTVIPYEADAYINKARLKEIRTKFEFQPFIIFSDYAEHERQGGGALAKLIQEQKLGPLHITSPRTNWTGKKIITCLWEVDYEALAKYLSSVGAAPYPLSAQAMAALEPAKVEAPPATPTPPRVATINF